MIDLLILEGILLIFFVWSALLSNTTNTGNFSWKDLRRRGRTISPAYPIAILALIVLAFAIIILKYPGDFLLIYLKGVLSIIILAHAWWFSLHKKKAVWIAAFAVALFIILWRWLDPSAVSHDLFLAAALVWIGPFFVQQKILTAQRLIVLGALLFFYDIIYVWLTPTAQYLSAVGGGIGFPFALFVGGISIGTGDILWGNFVLAVVKRKKYQFGLIAAFIIADILLGMFAYGTNYTSFFPLLILWAPIGIFSLSLLRDDLRWKK
jgi:hypothetical protein